MQKIRARGGKVVFVRLPVSRALKALEDRATPRASPWNRLLRETGAPGIYFEDYPELARFDCPEWSHLSVPDSIVFTHRLVPYLRKVIAGNGTLPRPTRPLHCEVGPGPFELGREKRRGSRGEVRPKERDRG